MNDFNYVIAVMLGAACVLTLLWVLSKRNKPGIEMWRHYCPREDYTFFVSSTEMETMMRVGEMHKMQHRLKDQLNKGGSWVLDPETGNKWFDPDAKKPPWMEP